MKNYQYKLTYDKTFTSVPNSGGADTTDWINAVSGVAEDWEKVGPGGLASIIAGGGFTGNAQKYIKNSSGNRGLKSIISISCQQGKKVKLNLRYSANFTDWNVLVNDTLIGVLPDTSGIATDIEIEFIPERYQLNKIEIVEQGTGNPSEFVIDELEFTFIDNPIEILTKNPIGWNDLGVSFVRNDTYNSVLRTFALSLRFTKKPGAGGSNIETTYYIDGISGKVSIVISERDPQTNGYRVFYTGIIDFNPKRFKNERDWVQAGIIDSGKLQDFISRDEINFNIKSIISADNISVTPFQRSPRGIIFKPIDIYLNTVQLGIFSDPRLIILQLVNDILEVNYFAGNSEELGTGITINELGDRLKTADGDVIPYVNPIGLTVYYAENTTPEIYNNENDYPVQLNFSDTSISFNSSKVSLSANGTITVVASIFIRIIDEDDIDILSLGIFVQSITRTDPLTELVNINFNLDYLKLAIWNVPPRARMTLVSSIELIASTGTAAIIPSINYKANLNFTEISLSLGQTAVQSFFPFESFARLIQLMTSEQNTGALLDSEYLGRTNSEFTQYGVNGPGSLDAITTGWNLRAFPDNTFNINLKNLFSSFDDVHGLGLGYDRVNDRFYIETIDQFYDAGYLMFDLGEVVAMVKTPYEKAFDSRILSGYNEKGDYEDFQGVNEFNLQSEHSLSLPVKRTKPGRSVYNYDSIGMELARRLQYSNNASKDSRYDEKIYIVHTDGNYTIQGGPDLSGFDGIEEYYNLKYTPRENLIRNAGYYKGGLWNHELRIKFIKAAKDKDITYTNQNGDLVNEFDDLTEDDLQKPPLYVPEQYEFEGILTPEFLEILNSNPHGYIRFSFDGQTYEGYLLTVESGYFNRKATYKLIAKELTFGDNYIFEEEENFVFEDEDNSVFD